MARLRSAVPVLVVLAAAALGGCGSHSGVALDPGVSDTVASSSAKPTPTPSDKDSPGQGDSDGDAGYTGCGDWARQGSALATDVQEKYGEINDCGSIHGVWLMTTDESDQGVGSIGYHVCQGDCGSDVPKDISQWTFDTPQGDPGTYSRFAGVNTDGTFLFVSGSGELALDPRTGDLKREAQ
jgi:hypothetical protein